MDMEKKKLSYKEVAETMSGLVKDVNVIEERMEQLRSMGNRCCQIIGMYSRMNHPNRDELTRVYKNNLECLTREFKELELEREKLMYNKM